jgi:DNA-directed RNA polymerase subunit RPC12/RpoP
VRPIGLLIGLALLGSGLYFAMVWIPARDFARLQLDTVTGAKNSGIALAQGEMLSPDDVDLLTKGAWALVVLGAAQTLGGSVRRVGRVGYCKKCDQQVGARKKALKFGLRCERCGSRVSV